MCWKSNKGKDKIANEDIRIFKITRVDATIYGEKVRPYFSSPFVPKPFEYEEGKNYGTDTPFFLDRRIVERRNVDGQYSHKFVFFVDDAMHSYSTANVRLTVEDAELHCIRVYTHKTTKESPDVLTHYSQSYLCENAALMLCTIPKGTRYAVNEVGEVVSDNIRVDKIYIRPFTFNKDTTPSKRGVQKINKIIDNWEKGVIDVLN